MQLSRLSPEASDHSIQTSHIRYRLPPIICYSPPSHTAPLSPFRVSALPRDGKAIPIGRRYLLCTVAHLYDGTMTKTEMKKLLRMMPKEQLETALMELYSRQEKPKKEVFELLLKAIAEEKPLPERHAAVPDTKNIRKKLDRFYTRMFQGGFLRSPRVRRKAKKDLKEMLESLLLCPETSVAYPDVCSVLEDLFAVSCPFLNSDLFPGENVYTVFRMTTDDFFRTVASFILKSGYTRDNLKRLSSATCLVNSSDDALSLHLQEILVSLLKNGDLRMEMLEILEDRIQAGYKLQEAEGLLERLCFLYLLICEKESSLDYGASWIDGVTDEHKGQSLLRRFKQIRSEVQKLDKKNQG